KRLQPHRRAATCSAELVGHSAHLREPRSRRTGLFRYFGASVGNRVVSAGAVLLILGAMGINVLVHHETSTTAALKIHIMRISRLSSCWSGMAHTLVFWWAGAMIAGGAAGVNCDNYR